MPALPDAESVLVAALRAQPAVSGLVGGRVATRLGATFPAVRVTLVGGPPRLSEGTSQPELQVDCVAAGGTPQDEGVAAAVAYAVEGCITTLPGTYPAGRVVGAYPVGGIIHSPFSDTNRERYIVQIGLVVQ